MHHPIAVLQAWCKAVTSHTGGKCLLLPLLDNKHLSAHRARLPDPQLVLAGSSGEAGRTGVAAWHGRWSQHLTVHPHCYLGLTKHLRVVRPSKGVPSPVWQLQDDVSKAALPRDVPRDPFLVQDKRTSLWASYHLASFTLLMGRGKEGEHQAGCTPT